jgi:uncharacterized protein (DUF1501 family)
MTDHNHLPPVSRALAGAAREGCSESRLLLSRRTMLGVTAGLFSSAFLPNFAKADTNPEARFLVIILRGGMDGIGMLVPKLEPLYQSVRGSLALPFDSTLSLGSDFALHPALAGVQAMFLAGDAAFAPASGLPLRNRSHFECQDNLENGLPANAPDSTGWLNRLLGTLPAGDPIRTKMGIGIGGAPLILRGPEPVLGWSPTWFEKSLPGNIKRLQTAYKATDPSLWDSLQRGLAADRLALAAGADSGSNISELRKGFIGAARLMRAANGPRIAVLSVDGWDMHTDEGGTTGPLNDLLLELDQAIGDLKTELGTVWASTVAVCVTEFGRTVKVNGGRGTDHGIGTVSMLVGGAVKSGFIGDWPGVADSQLFDGDLRPTVDVRSIFKGVLRDHIGVPAPVLESTVFPDSADAPPADNLIDAPAVAPAKRPESFERPLTLQEVAPIARYRQRYGTPTDT